MHIHTDINRHRPSSFAFAVLGLWCDVLCCAVSCAVLCVTNHILLWHFLYSVSVLLCAVFTHIHTHTYPMNGTKPNQTFELDRRTSPFPISSFSLLPWISDKWRHSLALLSLTSLSHFSLVHRICIEPFQTTWCMKARKVDKLCCHCHCHCHVPSDSEVVKYSVCCSFSSLT